MNNKNILIIGVVGIVIVGGILLYSSGKISQPTNQGQKESEGTRSQPAVSSIAGKVVSVDVANNSFVLLQQKEERQFVVKLGEATEFIRLVFPFDIANPPAEATFTPERKVITIKDVKENDQAFVRSATPIKTGQELVNPLEIQILP